MELVANQFHVLIKKFSEILYQVLGFLPLFTDQNPSKFSEVVVKFWSFVVTAFTTINILTIVRNQDVIFDGSSIGKVNDLLKFSCATVAVYVFILESLMNVGKLKSFFKMIESFRAECKSLNVDFESYNMKMTKNYATQFAFIVIMQLFVEVFVVATVEWTESWSANIFPACVCRIRHLQYIYFLHLIQSKISILNDEIEKLVKQSRVRFLSTDSTLDCLQSIKTAYGILWNAVVELNEIFTWSLTANLVQNFVQIGCDTYWTYVSVFREPQSRVYRTVLFFCLNVSPVILISTVLFEANKVKTEALKIPVKLHSLKKSKQEVELYKMVSKSFKLNS